MKISEFNFDIIADKIKNLTVSDNALTIRFSNSIEDDEWFFGIKIIEVLDCKIIVYGTVGGYIQTYQVNFDNEMEEALEEVEKSLNEIVEDMDKLVNVDRQYIEVFIEYDSEL